MKKIGRYNRKIGIGIGSSEGQNFAHIWCWCVDIATQALFPFHLESLLLLFGDQHVKISKPSRVNTS
jgi:hypothetical protein